MFPNHWLLTRVKDEGEIRAKATDHSTWFPTETEDHWIWPNGKILHQKIMYVDHTNKHTEELTSLTQTLQVPLSWQGSLYISFFTVEKNSISPQTHRQGKFLGHLQFAAETTVQPVNKATSTRCPGPTPTLYAPCLETRFKSCWF